MHYLSPTLNTAPWMPSEDALLLKMHAELGNRWAKIGQSFADRTAVMVKNRVLALGRIGAAPLLGPPPLPPDEDCERIFADPVHGFGFGPDDW